MSIRSKTRSNQARDLIVRRAKPADAPVLVQLVRQLNERQGNPPGPFTVAAAKRDVFGKSPRVDALVAVLDGEVVAYAFLIPAYDSAAAARGMIVTDMHVTPPARARGVSLAMMEACAAHATAQGASYLSWMSKAWDVEEQAFYGKVSAAEEPVMAHALTRAGFAKLAAAGARHYKVGRKTSLK